MTATRLRPIISAAVLLLCMVLPAPAQTAGAGVSFVAALPTTAPSPENYPTTVTLLLASELGSNVAMIPSNGAPTSSVTIPPGSSIEIPVDSASVLAPMTPGIWRSSLRLTGTEPFTATLLIDRSFAVEAVALIPDAEQQREAFVVGSEENQRGGMMIVVGLISNTTVTITPSVPTADGHAARVPYTVQLGLGDVYQTLTASAGTEGDLSGTRVESTEPVSVIGGTYCTDFPIGADHACNPLVEAMPHVGCLGNQFVFAPLARQIRSRARIVATQDSTAVTLEGTSLLGVLQRGESMDLSADTAVLITASRPAIMEQYLTSTATGFGDLALAYGDPGMMTVPPLECDARAVRTVFPTLGPRSYITGTAGWDYYVQAVCDSAAFSSIRVNGNPVRWSRTDNTGRYRLGVLALGPGELTITCDSSIGVQLYAYSIQDAFGTTPYSCAHVLPVEPEPEPDTSHYLRLRLVGTSVPVGGDSAVALVLDSAGGFRPGDSISFDLDLVWDRSVAVPKDVVEGMRWRMEKLGSAVNGESWRTTLRLRSVADTLGIVAAPDTIGHLGLVGALGAERSWVSITPLLSDTTLSIDTVGDVLTITGQCTEGSLRLVRVGPPLLRTLAVDPVGRAVQVEIDTGAYGCRVELADPLGRVVRVKDAGAEPVRFEALVPGWYLLLLRTEDGREERRALVVP